MWDADNLYALLETVTPTVTVIPNKPFDSDGWEIYLDSTNSHNPVYGSGDFHCVLPVGGTDILEVAHNAKLGGICSSFKWARGYMIKAQIPLKSIGVAGCNGEIFGIDFNVTDNHPGRERFKRAWWATSDNDWQLPSAFGTAKLTWMPPPKCRLADIPTVAVRPGNSSATLTWNPVPGAVGYLIQRAITGEPLATIDSLPDHFCRRHDMPAEVNGSVTYTDKGLEESNTYDYAIIPYSTGGPGTASKPVTVQPLTEVAKPGSIMIHCGGPAAGRFAADEFFTGGKTAANYAGPIVRHVIDPAPSVVYQTERNGKFSYSIPGLTPGKTYLVRLHFCENYWTAPGQRIFTVLFNDAEVLRDFDIFKDAGGAHTAVIREILYTAAPGGNFNITFTAKQNGPVIQAIEVIPK